MIIKEEEKDLLFKRAVEKLSSGGIVAMPTETVYGLAGSIRHPSAIEKIFKIKNRPLFDPLIVHVSNVQQAKDIVENWSLLAEQLVSVFWPGPLTLVLKKKKTVSDLITAGLDTVAIRMPSHPLALSLIEKFGFPVAAPSANKFKKTSPTTAAHVESEFSESDLIILDGGTCSIGLESTVIELKENEINVLRPGFILSSDLEEFCFNHSFSVAINRRSSLKSPGNLTEHYQPKKPLVVVPERTRAIINKASGVLKTGPLFQEIKLSDDPIWAARHLYSQMRKLSEQDIDFLLIIQHPHLRGGFWEAIWDRIHKAATLVL